MKAKSRPQGTRSGSRRQPLPEAPRPVAVKGRPGPTTTRALSMGRQLLVLRGLAYDLSDAVVDRDYVRAQLGPRATVDALRATIALLERRARRTYKQEVVSHVLAEPTAELVSRLLDARRGGRDVLALSRRGNAARTAEATRRKEAYIEAARAIRTKHSTWSLARIADELAKRPPAGFTKPLKSARQIQRYLRDADPLIGPPV